MTEERLALCRNDPTQLCPDNCRLFKKNRRGWELNTLLVNIVSRIMGIKERFTVNDLVETVQALAIERGHKIIKPLPNPLCIRN